MTERKQRKKLNNTVSRKKETRMKGYQEKEGRTSNRKKEGKKDKE